MVLIPNSNEQPTHEPPVPQNQPMGNNYKNGFCKPPLEAKSLRAQKKDHFRHPPLRRPVTAKVANIPHSTLIITVVTALLFFGFNALQLTQAEGGATATNLLPYPFQDTSTDINYACEPDMKVFAANRLEDYRNFLENNFQNKSSTSSLLEPAMGKYRELRQVLMTAYSKYYPNQGSLLLTTGLQPSACLTIINETLSNARTILSQHAARTSGVKKTTALLEKYKEINNQLQNLGQQLVTTKAYLDAFSQKISCYLPKGACVKN